MSVGVKEGGQSVTKHARVSEVVDALEYWLRGKEFRQRSTYHKQLNQYQFAVRELARHADDGNIDGILARYQPFLCRVTSFYGTRSNLLLRQQTQGPSITREVETGSRHRCVVHCTALAIPTKHLNRRAIMLRRKRILIGTLAAVAACVFFSLSGAGEEPPQLTSEKDPEKSAIVMKNKLRYTQQILTSLAREDYPKLENGAQELRLIAHQQWEDNSTPEYRAQLQVFWTTLEAIETGAQRKDIEEATLAYMQMTLSCVKCHKVIRRERRRQ